MTKINLKLRRKARCLALQAIYQWQLSALPTAEIEKQFLQAAQPDKVDVAYFFELLHSIPRDVVELDSYVKSCLDRPIEDLYPVELAILRMAVYEFLHRPDVPYRVVINEALELSKTYGAPEGFKYVNGVLDKIARQLRKAEMQS